MIKMYILVTEEVRKSLVASPLITIAEFGGEMVLRAKANKETELIAAGTISLLEGEQKDFNTLLTTNEQLWVTDHPMIGNWTQYSLEKK